MARLGGAREKQRRLAPLGTSERLAPAGLLRGSSARRLLSAAGLPSTAGLVQGFFVTTRRRSPPTRGRGAASNVFSHTSRCLLLACARLPRHGAYCHTVHASRCRPGKLYTEGQTLVCLPVFAARWCFGSCAAPSSGLASWPRSWGQPTPVANVCVCVVPNPKVTTTTRKGGVPLLVPRPKLQGPAASRLAPGRAGRRPSSSVGAGPLSVLQAPVSVLQVSLKLPAQLRSIQTNGKTLIKHSMRYLHTQ